MLTKRIIIALTITVTSTWIAFAQEPERVVEANRIRSVIADINKARSHSDAKAFAQLFAPDGELQIGNKIIATGPSAIENALQRPDIWSEKTPPIIENESVRLLSSDVALVDAIQAQYGSIILKQSAPVILLLKRNGNKWRIISLRLFAINPPLSTGTR